jgi:hypothetical protein
VVAVVALADTGYTVARLFNALAAVVVRPAPPSHHGGQRAAVAAMTQRASFFADRQTVPAGRRGRSVCAEVAVPAR